MRRQTRVRLFTLLLFLLSFAAHASAQEKCLPYETDGIKLVGTLSKKTFPGPPNYESIRKGDRPETSWVLHLAAPVCTTASGDNDAESNVTDLQLILTEKQYALYRRFVGGRTRVTITGKLTHAITGHHHTAVLMEVVSISR